MKIPTSTNQQLENMRFLEGIAKPNFDTYSNHVTLDSDDMLIELQGNICRKPVC